MIVLGLTGSIGMGKTTTAEMFTEAGVPVHSADAAVHALYAQGGAAVAAIEQAFPGVTHDGAVDRAHLAQRIIGDDEAHHLLESLVHPLVAASRDGFFDSAAADGAKVVVVDIPLLFETGGDRLVDAVVVVSAQPSVQRQRVLSRPGMTEEKFDALLSRQTPDAEKRARADFLVETDQGLEAARDQVKRILATVLAPDWRSRRTRRPDAS
ncbi:MAG: dephospho-CoA kinase [Caulobacteraceae bacterium]